MPSKSRADRVRRQTVLSALLLPMVLGVVGCEGLSGGTGEGADAASWRFESLLHEFRVVTVTDQLERPWSLAFLPDGTMLVTEREGRLRVIREGSLDPEPLLGVPETRSEGAQARRNGLMDLALHPEFERNRLLYFTYTRPDPAGRITTALATARYEGGEALLDVRDIFIAENWIEPDISQTSLSRIVFGPDGMVYMTLGAPNATASSGPFARSRGGRAQDPGSHGGKVLRLRQDGSVPPDNPFVGRPGYLPEIFTMGHRNTMGLLVHPETGELWMSEAGPRDGDEINILRAGGNYGWPTVGIGRDYSGDYIGGSLAAGEEGGREDARNFYLPGMEQPYLFWVPAVTPAGMAFYQGDRFPNWSGSLFIATLNGKRVERVSFDRRGNPNRAEYLLAELGQRIRDVREGPDGFLYILTDHETVAGDPRASASERGMILRIEPVD